MFSLMDKVPSGIEPMLKDLEEHIINAGLADMVAAAETITTVCTQAEVHYTLLCASTLDPQNNIGTHSPFFDKSFSFFLCVFLCRTRRSMWSSC